MSINIILDFKKGPWGGGNQFLKALKNNLTKRRLHSEDPRDANIILFNSHHNLKKVLILKFKYPQKKFFHRVDGPICYIRGKHRETDNLIFKFSKKIADFTIFQSRWSMRKCIALGFKGDNFAVIHNSPDSNIFNRDGKCGFSTARKIRIIAASWSKNMNKGFETYKYLDENLDFNKYEFVFFGNSPVKFKNIRHIPPVDSRRLARELKNSDIFITASKNDPCSNSLIEALSCGLPALVLASGGHPELVGKGGEIFENNDEIDEKLEKLVGNYSEYQKNIPTYDIKETTSQYLEIFLKQESESSKKIGYLDFVIFILRIHFNGFSNKINFYLEKLQIR